MKKMMKKKKNKILNKMLKKMMKKKKNKMLKKNKNKKIKQPMLKCKTTYVVCRDAGGNKENLIIQGDNHLRCAPWLLISILLSS